jgi:hypothetical protein
VVVTHRYFQETETIFKELEEKHKPISVELRTALLKAFPLSGDLSKVDALFQQELALMQKYGFDPFFAERATDVTEYRRLSRDISFVCPVSFEFRAPHLPALLLEIGIEQCDETCDACDVKYSCHLFQN